MKGVRDIEVDPVNGLIFVAEETLKMVLVYSINDDYTNSFNISYGTSDTEAEPIGLAIDTEHHANVVFVGDNGYDAVFAFKYEALSDGDGYLYHLLWKTEPLDYLKHPAGIAVHGDSVYVVSQKRNLILRFDAESGKYIDAFVDFSKRKITGENLLYVPGDGC